MTIICGVCRGEDSKISLGYVPRGNDRYTTFRQCTVCKIVSIYNIEVDPNMGSVAGKDLSHIEPFCSVPFGEPVLSFKPSPRFQSSNRKVIK